jgi:hypothetical protein
MLKMPKIKAKAKLVEHVRSVVGNTRAHSVVCDLSAAAGDVSPYPYKE